MTNHYADCNKAKDSSVFNTFYLDWMKIGFIGTGFIGGNMAQNFKERGFDVIQYSLEPEYINNLKKVQDADIVFVAVPTPTKNRKFDRSVLEDAMSKTRPGQKIVIKSTVLCGTTDYFQGLYQDRYFFHSAEFLTEKNAKGDVDNPSRNVVGYTDISKPFSSDIMNILPEAINGNIICTAKESELGKYASNFLLTAKIIMANLIYDVCEKYGVNYNNVKNIAAKDSRIGESHLSVIFDGGRGANGHCFPKDLSAFHEMYGKYNDLGNKLLETLEEYNAKLNIDSNKDIEIIKNVLGDKFIDSLP